MIETEISTHNFIYNPGTFTFIKKNNLTNDTKPLLNTEATHN